jgi:hypothetical protein
MVPSGRCFSKRFGCGRPLKVPWAVRLRCLLEHHVGTRATIFAASVSLLSRRPGHATALTWPGATSTNANTTPQTVCWQATRALKRLCPRQIGQSEGDGGVALAEGRIGPRAGPPSRRPPRRRHRRTTCDDYGRSSQVSNAAPSSRRTVVREDWALVALVGGGRRDEPRRRGRRSRGSDHHFVGTAAEFSEVEEQQRARGSGHRRI